MVSELRFGAICHFWVAFAPVRVSKSTKRPSRGRDWKFPKTEKICFYKCKILWYIVVSELRFGAICPFRCAFAPVRVSKSTKRPSRPHERKFRKTKKICFYKCKILWYKVVSELHFGAICHFRCAFALVCVSKLTKRPSRPHEREF